MQKLKEWVRYFGKTDRSLTDWGYADEAKRQAANAQIGVELLIEVVKEQQQIIEMLTDRLDDAEKEIGTYVGG